METRDAKNSSEREKKLLLNSKEEKKKTLEGKHPARARKKMGYPRQDYAWNWFAKPILQGWS